MKSIWIELNEWELERAAITAVEVHTENERRGGVNLGFFKRGKDPIQIVAEGMEAEMVFSRFLGRPWPGWSWEKRNDGDVYGHEIRSTEVRFGNLPIYDKDKPERPFTLIRGHLWPKLELVGWYWGRDGFRDGKKQEGKDWTRPTWLVSAKLLHPMSTLPNLELTP